MNMSWFIVSLFTVGNIKCGKRNASLFSDLMSNVEVRPTQVSQERIQQASKLPQRIQRLYYNMIALLAKARDTGNLGQQQCMLSLLPVTWEEVCSEKNLPTTNKRGRNTTGLHYSILGYNKLLRIPSKCQNMRHGSFCACAFVECRLWPFSSHPIRTGPGFSQVSDGRKDLFCCFGRISNFGGFPGEGVGWLRRSPLGPRLV